MKKWNPVDAQAIAAEFLALYLEDQAAGRTRSLDEYRALFPGGEDAVARELEALEGEAVRSRTAAEPESDIAVRLAQDRGRGLEPKLADYLALFPGRDLEVADAFARRAGASMPPPGSASEPALAVPERMGSYAIQRELGRGGQATVYLARDTKLDRLVALKVFVTASGLPTASVRQRFEREALTAARLDHPNLCAVHEVGEEGMLAYIAMRFVPGETLAARIASARRARAENDTSVLALASGGGAGEPGATTSREASLSGTLQVVEELARAVHVAHEAGVLHRDIKPGNVMLTREGRPVLLDFGLAQSPDDTEFPSLTRTGDVLGTPSYMAPEQVRGDKAAVDRRTDVYALAATLYEALTGRCPFQAADVQSLYQKILTQDPVRADRLSKGVPTDLGIVLAMALEKEPKRRYATALDFAEDLRRVRVHEPIRATAASAVSQIQKFVRRHRGLSAGLVLAGLSLLVAAAAVYHALQPVEAPIPVTLSAGASEWVAYREEFDACLAALEAGDQVEALRIHEGMATDKRGWEWDFLGAHFDQTLAHHDADFYEAPLGFDEAGRALSVRRVDDRAELFDVERGERIADLGPAAHRTIFRFDTDVTRIAKIHESRVRVHDLETLDVLLEVPTVEDGMTVDLEGDTLAIGTPDGRIDVWSVARRERNFTFEPSAPLTSSWRIELDRTGRVLACAQRPLPGEPTVMLLDAATGERLAERPFPSSAFNAAAMSRDGSLLAVTQPTGLHVLELPSLETRLAILGSEFDTRQPLTGSAIACLAFTPDGRAVLNSPATGIVTGYDVSSGEISSTRVVPVGALRTLVRSDGARALTSGHGRARYVHLQALGRPSVRVLADHDAPVHAIAMDPEGAWLATGDTGGAIHLRNLSGAGLEATVRVEGAVRQLWFAGGGSRLAARGGSEEAELVLWDLSGERPMLVPATATEPKPPGGARMRGAGREVVTSVLSPDARVELITGSEDSIRVVDARTRKRLHVLPGHDGGTAAVAVSADGRWIASAGRADGTIKLWERPTGEQVVTITAGAVGLLDLDFHPDGRRLASVGSDGAVRLWELESFQLAAVFPGDARAARFSSDGSQLLAALADGTVRAWDSVPPHERERE